jgi:hypothetical protein
MKMIGPKAALQILGGLTLALSASAAASCTTNSDDADPVTDAAVPSDASPATLTIVNDSDVILTEIRVARTDLEEPYGPDLIPADLFPGDEVVIVFDCDFYDVLIVDDFEAECELIDVDLCFPDATWLITNSQLSPCFELATRSTTLKSAKQASP